MNPALDLPGFASPTDQAREAANYREHIRVDVANWPEALAARWQEIVSTNHGARWLKYSAAEVELRAWLELRAPLAREPVVLNRHHLTPSAPQAIGSSAWPPGALYCGRAPMAAPTLDRAGGEAWRYAHLLGNPYSRDAYPDALERYRLDLRRWMRHDNAARAALALEPKCGAQRSARVDAIRDLDRSAVLVCSCVTSPWTPTIVVPPDDPLPIAVSCHCHLIVAAWRALQPRPVARADQPVSTPLTAPA